MLHPNKGLFTDLTNLFQFTLNAATLRLIALSKNILMSD
jgi:hypothetical protein